jgi:hypothetical protein
MYSDLLDVLGNQSSSVTRNNSGGDSDSHVVVSFKAGKMKMELQEVRNKEIRETLDVVSPCRGPVERCGGRGYCGTSHFLVLVGWGHAC